MGFPFFWKETWIYWFTGPRRLEKRTGLVSTFVKSNKSVVENEIKYFTLVVYRDKWCHV